MHKTITVVLFVVTFKEIQGVTKLPSYVEPCSKSEPDFNACALKNGRAAIPFITKGDPKYHILTVDPLILEKVDLDASNNLKMYLKNVTLTGLGSSDLKYIDWDLENRTIYINLMTPVVKVKAKYKIIGKILLLQLNGEGPLDFVHYDNNVTININYDTKRKSDKEYIDIKELKVSYDLAGVHMYLGNLLNNEQIGKQMNDFLNENWQEFYKQINPSICHVTEAIVLAILKPLSAKVPYDEIIKP